jgi:hypothetical protein
MLKTLFLAGLLSMVATSCEAEISQEIPDLGTPSRVGMGNDAGVFDAGVPDAKIPDTRVDVLFQDLLTTPDLGLDLIERPDLSATPDILVSGPEAGKEAAAACPAACFQGYYIGCGDNGQCKACPTYTCEVVTGICHC